MRTSSSSCLAAAALAAALGAGPWIGQASACDAGCGSYGFAPAYYAPAYRHYRAPVAVYTAPPVYAYSYFPPAAYGYYRPRYHRDYYRTRVNIFRGPRWNYSAAYYNPAPVHRGWRPYSAYVSGPIIRVWPARRRW